MRYTIKGIVEEGHGRASGMGFPTANIRTGQLPGAYVGIAYMHSVPIGGALVTSNGKISEVHIIGFDDNIYGMELAVDISARIPLEMTKTYVRLMNEQAG